MTGKSVRTKLTIDIVLFKNGELLPARGTEREIRSFSRLDKRTRTEQSLQRKKMKLETGRMEKRFPIAIPLRIESLDRLGLAEAAITQNVSLFGARILVGKKWQADERVIIESPGGVEPCPARVIYCQLLTSGGTAIGVNLARPRPAWMNHSART